MIRDRNEFCDSYWFRDYYDDTKELSSPFGTRFVSVIADYMKLKETSDAYGYQHQTDASGTEPVDPEVKERDESASRQGHDAQ